LDKNNASSDRIYKNLIRRLPRGNILSNAPIERSPMP